MDYSIKHLIVHVLPPQHFKNKKWDTYLAVGTSKETSVSREDQCSILIMRTSENMFFLQRETSFVVHHTCPLSFLLFDASDPEMNSIHLLSDYDEALFLANAICKFSMKKI